MAMTKKNRSLKKTQKLRETSPKDKKRHRLSKTVPSEGGADRTRVSTDGIALGSKNLRQRIVRLAAIWLQLAVSNEHELARMVTVSDNWASLSDSEKIEIESVSKNTNNPIKLNNKVSSEKLKETPD